MIGAFPVIGCLVLLTLLAVIRLVQLALAQAAPVQLAVGQAVALVRVAPAANQLPQRVAAAVVVHNNQILAIHMGEAGPPVTFRQVVVVLPVQVPQLGNLVGYVINRWSVFLLAMGQVQQQLALLPQVHLAVQPHQQRQDRAMLVSPLALPQPAHSLRC